MNPYKADLLEERAQLYFLIDYHTMRKAQIWDDEKEYQDYIDAALDRINDINAVLRDFENNEKN